jgi:flagellar protein FliL
MEENKKEEEQRPAKPAASPSKIIPIILIANTSLMGVVLAVVLLRKPASAGPAAPAAHATENKQTATGGTGGHEEGAGKGEHAEKSPSAAPEQSGAPGPILKLENFIIQLRGTDTDRYVRVAFDLELASDSDRSFVQGRMSQIRDAVISYFSDRSLDELRGSEGMERIKGAVLKKLEEILAARRVKSVFITELVIQ